MRAIVENQKTQRERRIRLATEVLLSLNLGFGVAYALFAYITDWYFASYAPRPIQKLLEWWGRSFLKVAPLIVSLPPNVRLRSVILWEVGFVVVMIVVGAFIFGLGRLLRRTPVGHFVLGPIAGFTALAAVPGCWFYMIEITRPGPELRQSFWPTCGAFFALEMTAAVVLVYLFRKRSLWWGTLIFVVHYLVWVCVMGAISGPPNFGSVVLSPIFPLSGIVWFRYARLRHVSAA
jgi:hypothetical protein